MKARVFNRGSDPSSRQIHRVLAEIWLQSVPRWMTLFVLGLPPTIVCLWVTSDQHDRLLWWLAAVVAAHALVGWQLVFRPRWRPLNQRTGAVMASALGGLTWGVLPLVAMPTTSDGQMFVAVLFAFTLPSAVMSNGGLRAANFAYILSYSIPWIVGWILFADNGWIAVLPALLAMPLISMAASDTLWRMHRKFAISTLEARRESRTDGLTGLINRRAFLEEVADRRTLSNHGVLYFIDIDRFKLVNDSFGHHAGDQLLIEAARRIRLEVGTQALIGRLGGDEIAVFISDPVRRGEVAAEALKTAFATPFLLDGRRTRVGVSIGAAPDGPTKPTNQQLLSRADLAMYEAKRTGQAVRWYDDALRERRSAELSLHNRIGEGLALGEFETWFQPICDARTGNIVSYEALTRWRRDGVVLSAAEFIDAADTGGALLQLTKLAVTQAVEFTHRLEHANVDVEGVSVNVNPLDLGALLTWLIETVETPSQLFLELTEHGATDTHELRETIAATTAAGLRIIIDDFGVEFSSLGRMTELPAYGLKIDRSFVEDMLGSRTANAIVRSTIELASALDMTLVAEGVESIEQSEALIRLGAFLQQGYLFGRAVTADEAIELAVSGRTTERAGVRLGRRKQIPHP